MHTHTTKTKHQNSMCLLDIYTFCLFIQQILKNMEGILEKAHKYLLMGTDISIENFQGYSKVMALPIFLMVMMYPGFVSTLFLIKSPHYSI